MDNVINQIKKIATKYNIDKIILFGSRARGDHSPVSDYDIAVFSNFLSAIDKACFSDDVGEINTLKKIDVVFVYEALNDDLMKNIKKDGVIIYEQIEDKIE